MPTSSETLVQLPDDVDLHARPAAQFVRTAMRYAAAITVHAGERHADAKSVLAVLGLGPGGARSCACAPRAATPCRRSTR